MASTTSGVRGATKTASQRAAASSPAKRMAQATKNAAQPTSATASVPATAGKRAIPSWTQASAREILSQSVINARETGLDVKVYQSTRGTVVIEIMAHRIVDGWIVPAEEESQK